MAKEDPHEPLKEGDLTLLCEVRCGSDVLCNHDLDIGQVEIDAEWNHVDISRKALPTGESSWSIAFRISDARSWGKTCAVPPLLLSISSIYNKNSNNNHTCCLSLHMYLTHPLEFFFSFIFPLESFECPTCVHMQTSSGHRITHII